MNNIYSDEFSSYINDHNKHGINLSLSGLVMRDCFDDKNPCNSVNNKYILETIKINNNLEIIHNNESESIVDKRI